MIIDKPDLFLHLTATGWTAVASIVSAISLIALGLFNFLYLRAANAQARAASLAINKAEDSNRIAQQAFQQQKRPWVGLDDGPIPAVIIGPVNIDKDGAATAQFQIRVKNFGDAPAQSVLASASLMITEDLADIQAEQGTLCKPNADQNIGLLLFPNATGAWGSASVFPSSRMVSKTFDHLFEAWLVGSIRYRDRFGNHYYTTFRYWMVDPPSLRPFRFTPKPGTQWAKPFAPHPTGGSAL